MTSEGKKKRKEPKKATVEVVIKPPAEGIRPHHLVILVPLAALILSFTMKFSVMGLLWAVLAQLGLGGKEASAVPSNVVTTHFLSALNEIATSIPRMDTVALAPTRNSQHTLRRRQTDMIESLGFNAALLDDAELAKRVAAVKSHIYTIHRQTAQSEDAFKEAVSSIEKTTAFLLKELPLLKIALVQQRSLDRTVTQLEAIINRIGALILELEQVTVPVAQLRADMQTLVSEIGIMEAHLQHLQQHTSVGLVAHDRASEEWRQASWFTTLSRPDQQKYEQLILLNRRIDGMQQSTRFLDDTFERAEVRINIALDHLRGTNRRLTDIYVELGQSATRIDVSRADGQTLQFSEGEVTQLDELCRATMEKIETIRAQNDPILNAIMVYGYGAIDSS